MTKAELVEQVLNTTTLSRSQAIDAVESVFNAVAGSLCKGENVYIRGFATFKAVTLKARKARNISKGVEMNIPARKSAKLIISKQLFNRLNPENGK